MIIQADEKMKLVLTYWSYAIAFQDCLEEGIEIDSETVDEFLTWINDNKKKLEEYGIFKM